MKITDISCVVGYINDSCMHITEAQLLDDMNNYSITDCVAYMHYSQISHKNGNAMLSEIAMLSSDRITACYTLAPDLGSAEMPSADGLALYLGKERPAAVRLYPNTSCFVLNRFYSGELLEVLNSLRIPVLLEEKEIPHFSQIPELARDFPHIPFVFLRMGLGKTNLIRPLLSKLDNIYFETSTMVDFGCIDDLVERYGDEKLLFGSGMPLWDPTGAIGLISYAKIKEESKEAIFSKNWHRLQEGIQWA